jgi:serine protease Do
MRHIVLSLLLLATAAPMAEAQQPRATAPRARVFSSSGDDGDRAMLGVSTASSGKRDTLGVLIESVTAGSPAEKAGLEEGNRIASINGVSLKLSKEDAGEPDMSGMMTSRLSREMRKVHAGDEVTLEVWSSGRYKTVRAKTVAADDLMPARVSRADQEDRPVLGISLGSSGSKRDTLGLFVSSVNEGGPADKAGVIEGDRIATINGVDLRVAKEDVSDWASANSRMQRLQREVRKLKPGETVDLGVVEGGRTRTVKVTLGRAKDLERTNGFSYSTSDGGSFFAMPPMQPMAPMAPMAPMMPMAPMAPMAPMPPSAPRARIWTFDGNDSVDFDTIRESLRDIGPRIRMELDRELPSAMDEVRRSMERLREEMPVIRARIAHGVII